MKVTKIELKNYLNFKDKFSIDFTYPLDHPVVNKRGKPLEKVCFIGPSGTGKTTILNIIKFFSFEDSINPDCLDQDLVKEENIGVHFLIGNSYSCSKWAIGQKLDDKNKHQTLQNVELLYKGENGLNSADCKKYIKEHFFKGDVVKLVAFPFDTIRNFYDVNNLLPNYQQTITKPEDEKIPIQQIRKKYLEKKVWDFSSDDIKWIEEIIADIVKEYEPDYLKALHKFLANANEDPINQKKYYEEFKKWENENVNPLKTYVQPLDKILNNFNLRVDTEIVHEKTEKRFPRIKQLNDNKEVPRAFLSTGTVQMIVTAIPLSVLNIDRAVILFDEPERSLYPDTQLGLISSYTSLVPNSQVFFATHSPIIASAFEPCERIVLFYNEDGKVDYVKGDSPEGDDPNDLLHRDFRMSTVLEKKGAEAFNRYVELKSLIHSEKNDAKKGVLMNEFMEIGNKYRFGT